MSTQDRMAYLLSAILLFAFLCAGCDETYAPTASSPVQVTAQVASPSAQCVKPDWSIDRSLADQHVWVSVDRVMDSLGVDGVGFKSRAMSFDFGPATFGKTYTARAKQGECEWTFDFPFERNADSSAPPRRSPTPPTSPSGPRQPVSVCVVTETPVAFVLAPGQWHVSVTSQEEAVEVFLDGAMVLATSSPDSPVAALVSLPGGAQQLTVKVVNPSWARGHQTCVEAR